MADRPLRPASPQFFPTTAARDYYIRAATARVESTGKPRAASRPGDPQIEDADGLPVGSQLQNDRCDAAASTMLVCWNRSPVPHPQTVQSARERSFNRFRAVMTPMWSVPTANCQYYEA